MGMFRLCFAAGREGHMLEAISYIHIRRYTPAPAVGMQVSQAFCYIYSFHQSLNFYPQRNIKRPKLSGSNKITEMKKQIIQEIKRTK